MIAGRTFESSPDNLNDAITKAKNIEAGNSLMFQGLGMSNINLNEDLFNKSQIKPKESNVEDEVDKLTKQLEGLKIAKLEKEIMNMKNEVYNKSKPQINTYKRQFNEPQYQSRQQANFRKLKCYNCNKIGHTAKYCMETRQRYNFMEPEEFDDEVIDYEDQQYFYWNEEDQDEYYYQDNEYYPAERTTRSQVRNNPLRGEKPIVNREPIIKRQTERNNDVEMTERIRRPYVKKGEGRYQIRPSRFETDAQEYDIVKDLENMKPNINFAQLVAATPKYGTEIKRAFQRQRIPREQSQN